MADILPFRPRPRPTVDRLAPTDQLAVRAEIEAAAQAALDAADQLIALLDRMEGEFDGEAGDDDTELSQGGPERRYAGQVVRLRENDEDREVKASNALLPIVAMEERQAETPSGSLPWSSYGNIVAAVGAGLLDMIVGR